MSTLGVNSATPNLIYRSPVVAFLGGDLYDARHIEFAQLIGRAVVGRTRLRICVTGYKGRPNKESPEAPFSSFGYAVCKGAAETLDEDEVGRRIITRPARSSMTSPMTFEIGTVEKPKGRNQKSRRLSILSAVDVVCLGAGGGGTQEIFDFARALDQPVLPLPFFMGATRAIWGRYRKNLAADFAMGNRASQRWLNIRLSEITPTTFEKLSFEVAATLVAGVRKRCLVCMPFAAHFDWVFDRIIQPCADVTCADLIRIDLENIVGDISNLFQDELSKADCVLAVVTGERANVLYEVGFAHAIGKEVLLLCQRDSGRMQTGDIPFYVRNHRTIWYPERYDEPGIAKVIEELCDTLRKV